MTREIAKLKKGTSPCPDAASHFWDVPNGSSVVTENIRALNSSVPAGPGPVLFPVAHSSRSGPSCDVMDVASIIGAYVASVGLFFPSNLRDIQWRKGVVRVRMNAVTRVGCMSRATTQAEWSLAA